MRSLEKAIASAQVYLDSTTPYFYGSTVWIEERQMSEWARRIEEVEE